MLLFNTYNNLKNWVKAAVLKFHLKMSPFFIFTVFMTVAVKGSMLIYSN